MSVTGLSRKDTAKSRLNVAWQDADADGEKQLDPKEVLKRLRGNDPRPLMILRDSKGDRKVTQLVDRIFKNEKVQLVTQWYNCVKVSNDVADEAHPYHKLFSGRKAPHMILASSDGSRITKCLTSSKDKMDWKDVVGVLKVDYKKNPDKAVKELGKLLNTFDKLDDQRSTLQEQITRAESKGKKSKIKSLKVKMTKVDKQFEAALKKEQKIKDLGLKRVAKTG